MSGHVDVQVKSCIEWLQGEFTCHNSGSRPKPMLINFSGERIEPRRYAAVLVLRELTRAAPALIYEHVPELLDNLWTALRDPKVRLVILTLIAQADLSEDRSLSEKPLPMPWRVACLSPRNAIRSHETKSSAWFSSRHNAVSS